MAQHRRQQVRHKHSAVATLIALGLVTLTISVGSSPSTAAAVLPPGFASELVAGGLDKVSDLYRLPDGWLVAEQCGRVRKIQGTTLLPTPVIDLRSTTNCTGDRGLLGVAANSTHLFVFRALENGLTGASGTKVAVLSRFVLNGAVADPASEADLLGGAGRSVAACGQLPVTADCIPIDGAAHSAAEIVILPDGSLVTAHGDGARAALVDERALRAQNANSLGGKVYHLSTSGDGVPTNPRYNPASPRSNVSRIMAEGVRNPYRFDVRSDGIMFGDVGWNDWEELDWLPFGGALRNYGWPCYEGGEQQPGYAALSVCRQLYADVAGGAEVVTPPVHAYTHTVDGQDIDSGVTGGVFYTGTSFPSAYNGAYFFTDFTRGQWYTAQVNATGSVVGQPTLFASDDYGAVDMEMGTDGSIYYARYPGEVRRMRFTGGTSITPVATENATPVSGQAPLAVQFSSAGSTDPDGGPVSMLWEFGDGGTSTLPNPVYMYLANGTFTARLTVTDDEGATATATVSITVGNRAPVPVITAPLATRTFSVGNSIYFEGRATDPEDGTVPASRFTWQINQHHCSAGGTCHLHNLTSRNGARSGSFVVEDHEDIWEYEIILTVTDARGLSASTSVRIKPKTTQLTIRTDRAGISVVLDSSAVTTPYTASVVQGSRHSVFMPTPQDGRAFASWSYGGLTRSANPFTFKLGAVTTASISLRTKTAS